MTAWEDLRPRAGHVLVVPDPHLVRLGQVWLPPAVVRDNPDWFPVTGTVRSTGPKVWDVAIGDRVLFGRYAGVELWIGRERALLLPEAQILGVLTGASTARQVPQTVPPPVLRSDRRTPTLAERCDRG